MQVQKIRLSAAAAAVLAVAGGVHAQQTSRTNARFTSVEQSMWASGAGFVYDFAQDYIVGAETGSLTVNPPAVSGSGVTIDTRFAVSAVADLGVGVGFGIDSGTVDAAMHYDIDMTAPILVRGGGFFDLELRGPPAAGLATRHALARRVREPRRDLRGLEQPVRRGDRQL